MTKLHQPHKSIWTSRFSRFTLVNSIESFAIGILIVVFNLLINERFGKTALVTAQCLFIAPKILFAPLAKKIIQKQGATLVARLTMAALALIFLLQALTTYYPLLLSTVLLRAFVGTCCVASLMTLQAWVIPPGKNVQANTIYLLTSRSLFFLAPFFIKITEGYLTTNTYFYLVAALLLLASLLTLGRALPHTCTPTIEENKNQASYTALWQLFKEKKILIHLFIPLCGFFIIVHLLHPFLIWSTSKAHCATLMATKGVGGCVVSFLLPIILHVATKCISMERLYIASRNLAILSLGALVCTHNLYIQMALIILSVIPQSIASVCFYTLLQKYLTKSEQSMVHTLTYPFTQSFILVGKMIAFGYTFFNYLNLSQFWLLITVSSLLIALPSLFIYQKSTLQKHISSISPKKQPFS